MPDWSTMKFGNIAEEHEQIKGRPEIRQPFGEWLMKKHNLVPGGLYLYGNGGLFYPTLDDIEEFFRIHPSLSKTLRISADTPLQDVISYLTEKSEIANMTANLMDSLNVSAHPIAQGGLADVYHAILPDGAQIAIKCLRHHDTKQVKHTARELNTWSKMKHKNVLELLGLALFRDRLAMVSPWMEYGGVRSVVNKWPQTDRYALCQQLASAVEYLHSEDVVHGDIKGENVLVGKDGQVKLTDFGLSIMHDQVLQFSETDPGGGTGRWMAPELFEEDSRRCRETDVYAMGMTMLEIITGQIPFSELRSGWAVIQAVKINRSTPSIAQLTKEPVSPRSVLMAGVLYRCWRHEPEERATAREVAVMMSLLGPV